jgi:tetratricopeptide (TPR) repeat protein
VVLPFLDLDTAAGDPEVTQWVADSLRSQLDSLEPARVVVGSVPSWNRPDEVRRAAQASKGRTILTGTVRNVDGQRRISLRLLSLAADRALLRGAITRTDTASRSAGNPEKWVLDIHNLLNTDSWDNLVPIDPGQRNEKAMQAMTAGRNLVNSYTVSDYDRAIALFREAIELVPDSALAHSYLAAAAVGRTHYMADFSFLELGKAEALKALELDPDSVAAHRALAGIYFQEGKFHEALEEQMRTMEIGGAESGIALFAAHTLDVLGRPDRAVTWCAIAARLHDTPGITEPTIGDCWTQLGDDEQAFAAYDRATELKPGSSQGALGRAHLHVLRGEFDAARELCRDHLRKYDPGEMAQIAAQIEFFDRKWAAAEELYARLSKADPDGGGSFYGAVTFQSALGRIQQASGLNESARTLLEAALTKETATLARQRSNPDVAYRVAAIEASLNSIEPALQHLRQAIVEGWLDYRSLQKDPRFDSVRNHPEFDALVDGLSAKVAELRSNAQREDKK